jgi:hypothetical protein
MAFGNWLSEQVGTNKWVVAGRLTPRLAGKGYMVAIHPKKFRAFIKQFEAAFGPAW